MKCCGRTYQNQAALTAHKGSKLHAERGGKPAGPAQGQRQKNPPQGQGRARASNEMIKMTMNVGPLLAGIPMEAQKALVNMPTMTAEGTLWLVAMLSPNSSDLAVSAKIPDHISTRSAVIKNYRPDVDIASPIPAGINNTGTWNCVIVQLPSLDIAALVVAWDPSAFAATPEIGSREGFGWGFWVKDAVDPVYRMAIPSSVGGVTERTTVVSSDLRNEDVVMIDMLSTVATTPPLTHWSPAVITVAESDQSLQDYSMWRLVAAGMTIGMRAAALTNQGTVYGVDCGRVVSEYCTRYCIAGALGATSAPPATTIGGANPAMKVSGRISWIEDFNLGDSFKQTDVCRDQAKRGSYTVLYPRQSDHHYIPFSKRGMFMPNDSDGGNDGPLRIVPVVGGAARLYMIRLDPSWGAKVVKYTGMARTSTLVMKVVSFAEYVINPSGGLNGLVTSAFPYDAVAMDTALSFAANLPVMYAETDNDWAGFWKKVGGFLGGVPKWINSRARPWIKNTGSAVSGFIQDSKDAASGIASHF